MSVDQVMAEVLRERPFYEESGGGVTFSGGEPFAQPRFLLGLLFAARNAGLHTAVDTCGFVPTEILTDAIPLTDLFLYDVKMIEDEKHRHYTGVSNKLILENLRVLDRTCTNIWVRIPLIPGVNDDAAEADSLVKLVAGLKSVRQVNILPYHKTGVHKARNLGKSNEFPTFDSALPERVQEFANKFTSVGVPVRIGG